MFTFGIFGTQETRLARPVASEYKVKPSSGDGDHRGRDKRISEFFGEDPENKK